ncbi:hypothetical protein ACQJBY_061466 [Aegilops geniculata]
MSVQVASPATAGEKTMTTAWAYVEYMAQWERQVERRQLFLRSYHFSRDAEVSPRARAPRRLGRGATPAPRRRQGAPTSPRAHPPLLRLGRPGAPPTLHHTPGRRPRVPLQPPPPEGAAGRRQRCVRLLLVARSRAAAWRARIESSKESQHGSTLVGFYCVCIPLLDAPVNITDSLAFLFLRRRSRAWSYS